MEIQQEPTIHSLRYISRSIIRSSSSCQVINDGRMIHLTPWDLRLLFLDYIQKGLLLPKPPNPLNLLHAPNQQQPHHPIISRLVTSLSQALDHFSPLAGRLSTIHHDTSPSIFIDCNNQGAEFIIAAAEDVVTSDIVTPLYVPDIIWSLFPLNGAVGLDGRTLPLLAIQLTELSDGSIFIGCSMNHAVVDGTSFWHFLNSWSEISRSGTHQTIPLPPVLDRWFPDSIKPPISLPLFKDPENIFTRFTPSPDVKECFFHFSPQTIKGLKARANLESSSSTQISSLQALLALVWRSVVRARKLEPCQEVTYILAGGNRSRIDPPLPAGYFGNSVTGIRAKAVVGDIIGKGLGWVALQLNRAVAAHTDVAIRNNLESWCNSPSLQQISSWASNIVLTGSSPRINVYGNDFGWGKPVTVRSGRGNKIDGKVTVYPGYEEGSMALEICLSFTALKSLVEDMEFMEATGRY